ncbi:hydrogenase maturation protease [Brevibacillus sp. LEMMJ03]|uniref:hydrogenase maturation protease n=1 Tax=Brevibacillus sp. LEMMJ03 TaxID=2595056 RepID=UPI00117DD169|nr:hydrogenase maturation protease [Brevibacillus sp. LEMMJ03]TRY24967.1 hydrogenase maturation protease [Brevibacillus sp. LEMMJ03]
MKRIVVLGLGNILLEDDGIGVYLVEDLSKRDPIKHVEYIVGETDVPFSLEMTRHADLLIIVDAVLTGKKPGQVTVFPCKKEQGFEKGISMHNLHFLEEALRVQRSWEGIIIGVEAESMGHHLGLSPILQEKYLETMRKVNEIIQTIASNQMIAPK